MVTRERVEIQISESGKHRDRDANNSRSFVRINLLDIHHRRDLSDLKNEEKKLPNVCPLRVAKKQPDYRGRVEKETRKLRVSRSPGRSA